MTILSPHPHRFIEETEYIVNSFQLGTAIHRSGYDPTFITGIWPGGCLVAMIVQECLQYLGNQADHMPIVLPTTPESMVHNEGPQPNQIQNIDYLRGELNKDSRLLVVYDMFDEQAQDEINQQLKDELDEHYPDQIRIAALWFNPIQSKGKNPPDYYLFRSDQKPVFPYQLQGLSEDEINRFKTGLSIENSALIVSPEEPQQP